MRLVKNHRRFGPRETLLRVAENLAEVEDPTNGDVWVQLGYDDQGVVVELILSPEQAGRLADLLVAAVKLLTAPPP